MVNEIRKAVAVALAAIFVFAVVFSAFYVSDFRVIAAYDGMVLIQNVDDEVFEFFDDRFHIHDRVIVVMYTGFTFDNRDDVVVFVTGF